MQATVDIMYACGHEVPTEVVSEISLTKENGPTEIDVEIPQYVVNQRAIVCPSCDSKVWEKKNDTE